GRGVSVAARGRRPLRADRARERPRRPGLLGQRAVEERDASPRGRARNPGGLVTAASKFVANADHTLIDSLSRTIDRTLAPLVPREHAVALVDFPRSANVGDSLIWLGTLAWLARNGHDAPAYVCSDL